ncbi:hypothetical protein [Shewanella sp. YLB-07]|uniref:hypothetical protein n=1 Tax=Shewanella sp. YLB-07 TaxID=2601268 RepID=UPI00128DC939|nr:hypothetical protein [Shewanella sp. YLB-07]MPY23403.1 hypothetical protein [Shewanella sp. YLB-07]
MKFTISAIVLSLFSCQSLAADYEGKSNAELARELANPNTPLTSLKFKTQYRTYTSSMLNRSNLAPRLSNCFINPPSAAHL